ncbi:MAG: hypothetical protein ACK50D_09465 [Burkholderiales bacterium]
MKTINEHPGLTKTALEVVCRLYVNGSVLGKHGTQYAVIELSAASVGATAFCDPTIFPELSAAANGEAVRCQLKPPRSVEPV